MKMAFATCVQLGLSCIEEIFRIGGKLDLLISLKDEKATNKSGRIYLDEIANRTDVPLLKIDNINDQEVISALHEHQIDWLFIIGWSQIAKRIAEHSYLWLHWHASNFTPCWKGKGRHSMGYP